MVKDTIPSKSCRVLMHHESMAKTPAQDRPWLSLNGDNEGVAICLSHVSGDVYVWLNKLNARRVGLWGAGSIFN